MISWVAAQLSTKVYSRFRPPSCSKRSVDEIFSWVTSFLQSYNNTYNIVTLYFWPYALFVKLISDFNLNIYPLASYSAVPEKKNSAYIFEKPLEFLGFLLYLWKFQAKHDFMSKNSTESSTPRNWNWNCPMAISSINDIAKCTVLLPRHTQVHANHITTHSHNKVNM